MRPLFFEELYKQMKNNDSIYVVTGDLGYIGFDRIRDEMPMRFINCGAAEIAMMGIACGLAIEGKIPFVYSIATFLLYRPFEAIRTYINHEKLNVKLIGSGRDKDYTHDGISHWSEDVKLLFGGWRAGEGEGILSNIKIYWPIKKEYIPSIVHDMIQYKGPEFLSLKR